MIYYLIITIDYINLCLIGKTDINCIKFEFPHILCQILFFKYYNIFTIYISFILKFQHLILVIRFFTRNICHLLFYLIIIRYLFLNFCLSKSFLIRVNILLNSFLTVCIKIYNCKTLSFYSNTLLSVNICRNDNVVYIISQ